MTEDDQSPEIEEELDSVEDPEERGDMAQEDPIDDMEDSKDRLDSLDERLSFLEEWADEEKVIPDVFDVVFPSRLQAFTSGTGGTWIERIASGTVMTDYLGGRFTSAAANPAAMFGLAETDFVTVEQVTADGVRAPSIPSGVVDCYLTDLGGGSYDGYLDAAKSLKIFAAQTGIPATAGATKGLARLVGTAWRFVGPLLTATGGASLLYAKTATGDSLTATGNFSAVTSAITMTTGATYRLNASLITSNDGGSGATLNGPTIELRLNSGGVGTLLGTSAPTGMPTGGAENRINLELEFTVLSASLINKRFVANTSLLVAGTLNPTNSPTITDSSESTGAGAYGIFVRWSAGSTHPSVGTGTLTLNTLTLEKLA